MARRLVLTGANGRMGRAVAPTLAGSFDVVPLDAPDADLFAWSGEADTIVHFAADWHDADRTFDMTRHLLRAATGLTRFVLASSVTVDPMGGVTRAFGPYQAAKVAAEAWARAWVDGHAERRAVALRLGHFDPGSRPPPEHEAVRLTEDGLRYWLDRALGDEPTVGTLTVWNALGAGPARAG